MKKCVHTKSLIKIDREEFKFEGYAIGTATTGTSNLVFINSKLTDHLIHKSTIIDPKILFIFQSYFFHSIHLTKKLDSIHSMIKS